MYKDKCSTARRSRVQEIGKVSLIHLIVVLFLSACATTPQKTAEEKCREAADYTRMAFALFPTNLLKATNYANDAIELCPTAYNMAFTAYLNAELGWFEYAINGLK